MSLNRTTKDLLRLEMKKRLSSISKESKVLQSHEIVSQLLRLPCYETSSRVAVYLNMKDEVQTGKIVEHIIQTGKECFIPWYNPSEMRLVKLATLDELAGLGRTKWNIQQHDNIEDKEDAFSTGGLDLVLVPGLAFTKQGHRLGRGKGYYDRFLQSMMSFRKEAGQTLVTVGLAFREQIVDYVPTNDSDFILDHVLSPA